MDMTGAARTTEGTTVDPTAGGRTTVTVDLGALRRNLELMVERVAPAQVMVVVKADAYGHGLLPVALTAVETGVRVLGVLDAGSGLALRAGGIGHDVRLFAWLFGPDEDYGRLVGAGIDLGISHLDQLERIADAVGSSPGDRADRVQARVHLKIDTGLHRNGATEAEWPHLVARALELERVGAIDLCGAWSHIGEASYDDDSTAIARFETAIARAGALGARFETRHLAASAAAFSRADARFDVVRIGAFCYGIAPGDGVGPEQLGLEPVMTVASEVVDVRQEGDRTIARVPVGFLDGIPGTAAGRVAVALGGTLYPVVSVGAAFLDLDVTGSAAAAGGVVTLFGPGRSGEQTLQEWADALDTIGEELAVRISPGFPRVYIDR